MQGRCLLGGRAKPPRSVATSPRIVVAVVVVGVHVAIEHASGSRLRPRTTAAQQARVVVAAAVVVVVRLGVVARVLVITLTSKLFIPCANSHADAIQFRVYETITPQALVMIRQLTAFGIVR